MFSYLLACRGQSIEQPTDLALKQWKQSYPCLHATIECPIWVSPRHNFPSGDIRSPADCPAFLRHRFPYRLELYFPHLSPHSYDIRQPGQRCSFLSGTNHPDIPSLTQTINLIRAMRNLVLIILVSFSAFVLGQETDEQIPFQVPFINSTGWTINSVPYSTRLYWMRQANEAVYNYSGPWFPQLYTCVANSSPVWAYGTVIVNHTDGRNELVCSGANNFTTSGGTFHRILS
jgi:hypothetical protein